MGVLDTTATSKMALSTLIIAAIETVFLWGVLANQKLGVGLGSTASLMLGFWLGGVAASKRQAWAAFGVATAIVAAWPAYRLVVGQDARTGAALIAIVLLPAGTAALTAAFMFAQRRGWVVNSFARQRNVPIILGLYLVARWLWHPNVVLSAVFLATIAANWFWRPRGAA